MTHTLYLCYFGVREPLVQTQVLPYLREINKLENLKVSLLTFEPDFKKKWTHERIEAEKKKLAEEGINWYCLPYHKRPSAPATLYDILNGVRFIRKMMRREKIDILHARTHIPVLMALMAGKFSQSDIIFDIRGLIAEEYADAGVWREKSMPFRFIKYIERMGIEKASQIVVLTTRMRDYLVENNLKKSENIEIIPCCVDFSRIKQSPEENQRNGRFELIYAGSVTGLYLLREMGSFFLELKKQKSDAFFRILTASAPQIVNQTFKELGIGENDYEVAKVSPDEVPKYLKKAHLGISFRRPTFSQIATSPTKIPEYLACGLPVISNSGVGDVDNLINGEKVGVILHEFSKKDYLKALEVINDLSQQGNLREHCRDIALKYFDLDKIGGERYRRLYRRLLRKSK